jgi:hypothetical protein
MFGSKLKDFRAITQHNVIIKNMTSQSVLIAIFTVKITGWEYQILFKE